jgi:hypothetical protein
MVIMFLRGTVGFADLLPQHAADPIASRSGCVCCATEAVAFAVDFSQGKRDSRANRNRV